MERGVERFVAGEYEAAIRDMEQALAGAEDDAVRRAAYTYIGRSHMALGHTEEAITAFTLGVQAGDRGPCVEYLELLKQYVEGVPGTLHTREFITRGELAGAIVRMMDPDAATAAPGAPTPLETAAARGWMPAPPDGREHAGDPVTFAALYVVAARLLAGDAAKPGADEVLRGGYRGAVVPGEPVSGAEALSVLERVRAIREGHGR